MNFKHDLVEQIDFKYRKSTTTDDFENNYDAIRAKAMVYDEKKEDYFSVGELDAYFFDIETSNVPIYEVLDSIDGDTATLISYFDLDYKRVTPKIGKIFNYDKEELMQMSANFIYLHMLKVDKKYRGKNIGKLLIRALLNDCKRDANFAFLNAIPLQFNSRLYDDDNKIKKINNSEFKNRTKDQSQKKLIELYQTCGFKLIDKKSTDMVADISGLYFE